MNHQLENEEEEAASQEPNTNVTQDADAFDLQEPNTGARQEPNTREAPAPDEN